MKRRNAETGKMRRTIKRTKITEGMYGNSMLYLKFVMVWAIIVMADYMLEFRFEFLFPFWMMLSSVYDTFKYQGLAFSVFFVFTALTSDMVCFFFMPVPWMFFAASTYVWLQCVWYTVADKGVGLTTLALCCIITYVEGVVRSNRGSAEFCRPLAAHCVGYPVVTLGFGFKSYLGHQLRLRRQRRVRAENEYYYQLMRDALPESALEEIQQEGQAKPVPAKDERPTSNGVESDHRHMNGSALGAKSKKCSKPPDQNGVCPQEHANLQFKLDKLEKHLLQTLSSKQPPAPVGNGSVAADAAADERTDTGKGSAKSSKCEKKDKDTSTIKEEKKKNRNKDKDKDREINDSNKGTDNSKESVKDVESTKENTKSNNNHTSKERDRERERERELHREREKELIFAMRRRNAALRPRHEKCRDVPQRSCQEDLRRARSELAAARTAQAQATRRALEAGAERVAAERDLHQLRHQHHQLQHKWRNACASGGGGGGGAGNAGGGGAGAGSAGAGAGPGAGAERASLERRVQEERRARHAAEAQLQRLAAQTTGECENETCVSRRSSSETESATMRRDLQRARERAARFSRDLSAASDQIRGLEQKLEQASESGRLSAAAAACQALQDRAAHLERTLSSETRVKLDLLSALGEAKRQLNIREGLIAKQEKEMQELKAQMLAVMPAEFVTPGSGSVSKLRLSDGSHLDPNASVYTPRQLCSDA